MIYFCKKILTLLSVVLLAACEMPTVSKFQDKKGKEQCIFKNGEVHVPKGIFTQGYQLRKINDDKFVFLLVFTTQYIAFDPLTSPDILVKIYNKDTSHPEEYRLKGDYKTFAGMAYEEYLKQSPYQNDEKKRLSFSSIAAEEIWAYAEGRYYYAYRYHGSENAFSFDLNFQLLDKIVKSDVTKIYIQTNKEPIELILKSDNKKELMQYQQLCSVAS